MTIREFTIHGGDYDHTRHVAGTYGDFRFRYESAARPQRIFIEMLESRRFEICEFSAANYLTLRASGEDWLTAVPVFPSRVFRHSLPVTRRTSNLTLLDQLAGKRVGLEDYSQTAAVWFRGLLHDEHGIAANDIHWVTRPKQRFAFPPGTNVDTTDDDLEELLGAGRLDAMLGLRLQDSSRPPDERRLRTVLAHPQAEAEKYYRRTGIFPIMHCVVIRSDVLHDNPGLPAAVMSAYTSSKRSGLGAWPSFLGDDPLPYGLTPQNRIVLERLATYLYQQGFTPCVPEIEGAFRMTTRL
jgi:4,5-dihydroxyphthalate decarboxylase